MADGAIPENAPLVLRRSAQRLGTYYGIFVVMLLALPVLGFFFVSIVSDLNWGAGFVAGIVTAPLALLGAGVLVWRLLAELRSGPTLAADVDGLWVMARRWPVRAQRLRWEDVAWIAVRRNGVDRAVCVLPRVEPAAPEQDRRERDQMRRQIKEFGVPYTASLTWGDRSERDVMATLDRLAAGRCQVATAPQ